VGAVVKPDRRPRSATKGCWLRTPITRPQPVADPFGQYRRHDRKTGRLAKEHQGGSRSRRDLLRRPGPKGNGTLQPGAFYLQCQKATYPMGGQRQCHRQTAWTIYLCPAPGAVTMATGNRLGPTMSAADQRKILTACCYGETALHLCSAKPMGKKLQPARGFDHDRGDILPAPNVKLTSANSAGGPRAAPGWVGRHVTWERPNHPPSRPNCNRANGRRNLQAYEAVRSWSSYKFLRQIPPKEKRRHLGDPPFSGSSPSCPDAWPAGGLRLRHLGRCKRKQGTCTPAVTPPPTLTWGAGTDDRPASSGRGLRRAGPKQARAYAKVARGSSLAAAGGRGRLGPARPSGPLIQQGPRESTFALTATDPMETVCTGGHVGGGEQRPCRGTSQSGPGAGSWRDNAGGGSGGSEFAMLGGPVAAHVMIGFFQVAWAMYWRQARLRYALHNSGPAPVSKPSMKPVDFQTIGEAAVTPWPAQGTSKVTLVKTSAQRRAAAGHRRTGDVQLPDCDFRFVPTYNASSRNQLSCSPGTTTF